MSERSKALFLGLFVIICAALIVWFVLFLRPSVGDGEKTLRIRFSNIEKVAVGTRVTFAGKPVGEVVEVCEILDARNQPTDKSGNIYFYELVVRIDSHIKVFNYDEIVFATAGLLGEKTIAIIPKQAPSGSPPAHELKEGVLYARSADKLEDTLAKLVEVADVVEQTMCEALCFLKENGPEFHKTLLSVNNCTSEVNAFFARANEIDLAGTFGHAMGSLDLIFNQVASGEGTLGKILYCDQLYFQLQSALCKFEMVMSDLSQFGLFYQFSRGWERQRKIRQQAGVYK